MLTILWDNDGVLVDTEGLYFRATQQVLRSVDVSITADQFKEISLRRGESCFILAAERGVTDGRLHRGRRLPAGPNRRKYGRAALSGGAQPLDSDWRFQ